MMIRGRASHQEILCHMVDSQTGDIPPLAVEERVHSIGSAVLCWPGRELYPSEFELRIGDTAVSDIAPHRPFRRKTLKINGQPADSVSCYQVVTDSGTTTFIDELHLPPQIPRTQRNLDKIMDQNPALQNANLSIGGFSSLKDRQFSGFHLITYAQLLSNELRTQRLPKEYGPAIYGRTIMALKQGADRVHPKEVIDRFLHRSANLKVASRP